MGARSDQTPARRPPTATSAAAIPAVVRSAGAALTSRAVNDQTLLESDVPIGEASAVNEIKVIEQALPADANTKASVGALLAKQRTNCGLQPEFYLSGDIYRLDIDK